MTLPDSLSPALPSRECGERARRAARAHPAAAKRCFVERGFHAASMADIAKAAEMSAGLLYRYFDGKGSIVAPSSTARWRRRGCCLDNISTSEDLIATILDHFGAGAGRRRSR